MDKQKDARIITEAADIIKTHGLDYAMALMDDLALLIIKHPHCDKEAFLASVESYKEVAEPKTRWMGLAVACETCKGSLTTGETFSVAFLGYPYNCWAVVCCNCAEYYDVQYGPGKGQKYSSQKPHYKLEG